MTAFLYQRSLIIGVGRARCQMAKSPLFRIIKIKTNGTGCIPSPRKYLTDHLEADHLKIYRE